MNKATRVVLSIVLMLLMFVPAVFAQSVSDVVKFNGVYQSISYLGQGRYAYSYYRFFPNEKVTAYSTFTEERVADVYKALEIAPSGSGKYTEKNGEISFSLSYAKGTVDYTGSKNEDKLKLVFHSNIINTDGKHECSFIEVANK